MKEENTAWKLCVGKHVIETKTQCVRDKNRSDRVIEKEEKCQSYPK